MDEFRRRYDVPRRDYGMPGGPPASPSPQTPNPQPAQPPAPHHQPAAPPHHQPPAQNQPRPEAYQPQQTVHQPTPPTMIDDLRPPTQRYTPPPTHHQPAVHNQPSALSRLSGQKYFKVAAAAALIVIALAAYMVMKPAPKPKQVLPADLAKQASFSFYYPSATTAGFNYDGTKSTFSNDQAYFLLNKGTEHLILREQNWSSDKLDTSSITSPKTVQTSIGQAAIGTNSGQTAAVVLAGHTLINITSNGSVPDEDIIAIINNLKNISPGQ